MSGTSPSYRYGAVRSEIPTKLNLFQKLFHTNKQYDAACGHLIPPCVQVLMVAGRLIDILWRWKVKITLISAEPLGNISQSFFFAPVKENMQQTLYSPSPSVVW